ncbi:uncharacterized protein LOC128213649 [Mya arenaria]|uniref:uncharacterized protein LOC128213649 n=1 Tax=Mya arenaria TaxID=6604 RepID=UPI0022E0B0B7|nr:uncharacterized protein LOC128213649 [Mya arenaria]
MVNSCSVFKCHNKANKSDNRKFFRLPEIILHQDDRTRELSTERRRSWLARLGQDFTGKNLSNIRVCSDHFISGQKSALYDRENPDWAPSINLGSTASTPSPLVATGRFARRRARSEKCEAARVLLSIGESCEPSLEEEAGTSSQTDLSSLVIDSVFNELAHVKKGNDSFREQLKTQTPYCIEFFKGNDDKVKYFTGLTSFLVLMELFGYLEDNILPGDLVMADRGFDIAASVGTLCAQVKIPAFTKGKSQMSPLDLESTRKLANLIQISMESG